MTFVRICELHAIDTSMRDVCADYDEVEIIENEELENGSQMTEEELDRRYEIYRTQDVDEIAKYSSMKIHDQIKLLELYEWL